MSEATYLALWVLLLGGTTLVLVWLDHYSRKERKP